MDTNLTNRNYTRQSHLLVNSKYALSRGEIDILLALFTAVKKEDLDFKDYSFTRADLELKTKKSWNSKNLKEIIESLMSKPLKIEVSPNHWKIFNWFSYFEFENGLITCRFDKALKPYLIQITGTRIIADFRYLLPMRSSYSKRMYLLLKEYDKIGKRKFNVEELQNILKVPKSKKNYDKFKSGVLKKAETDINKFTDLEVKLNDKDGKRGRKVVEITYTIKKNNTDLKAFVANIRGTYPNVLLHHSKDGRPLKCSDKGLLYYSDTMENINKKDSMKLWEYLHENRAKLTCFQGNLFDEEEVMKKLTRN